jgi:hypothetical protein
MIVMEEINLTTTVFTSYWVRKLIHFNRGKHIIANETIPESLEGQIQGGEVLGNLWRGQRDVSKGALGRQGGCGNGSNLLNINGGGVTIMLGDSGMASHRGTATDNRRNGKQVETT